MDSRNLVNRPAQQVTVTDGPNEQPNRTPLLTVFMICAFFVFALFPTVTEHLGYMVDMVEEKPLGFCAVVALLGAAWFAWKEV